MQVRFVLFRLVLLASIVIGAEQQALAQAAPTATAPSAPGPVNVLKESVRDLAGLASPDSLLILAAGAAGAFAVHPVERDINWQLAGSDYHFLGPGKALGDASVVGGISLATYLAGRSLGADSRAATIGQQLVRAELVTQLTTISIKTVARRERPDGSNQRSFPSGHASATFAAATILGGNFGWRVSVPAYLIATYVATSRLRENQHYASDVVFGSALGIAAGRVTLRRDHQSGRRVQPMLTTRGAGVIVTW